MYPVMVGVGVAVRWALMYVPLVFVTQLWAGSQYSPGQGGGWQELALWAGIFGVVTVAACVERTFNGDRIVDPQAVLKVAAIGHVVGAVIGHVVGAVIAILWFTAKGGPNQSDWFIAPATATVFVALWVHLLAARIPEEMEE